MSEKPKYTPVEMRTLVEVVRCEECKYKEGSCCDYSAVYIIPDGYCSFGERRADE